MVRTVKRLAVREGSQQGTIFVITTPLIEGMISGVVVTFERFPMTIFLRNQGAVEEILDMHYHS
jgi:hypothetical protein